MTKFLPPVTLITGKDERPAFHTAGLLLVLANNMGKEMGMDPLKKRLLALLLAACLLLASCGGSGGDASAASMRLKKAQGEVYLYDQKEESIAAAENTALYDGWRIDTEMQGFAWVELDQQRLAKLDEVSRAAIHKAGNDLEIEVEYGSLFFNIAAPLAEDESLTIRSSEMTVGIRGTCGWVRTVSPEQMYVYLLEGTVACTAGDAFMVISPGTLAVLTVIDGNGEIETRPVTRDEVPAFVREELAGDGQKLIDALPPSGGDGPAPEDGAGIDAPAGLEPPLMLTALRENAVSYEDILAIRIGAGGAPDMLDPPEAKGFINGIVLDLTKDGQDDLIAVSTDSMMRTTVTLYDQNGEKRGEANGSFYGSGEYGGGSSTLDILLFQSHTTGQWCVGFCNYIETGYMNVLDLSLYAIGENGMLGYIDRWYWDDISDENHAELPGLQAELEAAGWEYLNTSFLSIQNNAALDTCMLLSRATVRKDGNDRYLHIYSPQELGGAL